MVGAIVARVVADGVAGRDPLVGLARIRIFEISYEHGQWSTTIRIRWCGPPGRGKATLGKSS